MASEYTPYYNLDLYADDDKPNLRDQYNAAMRKVDTRMHTITDDMTIISTAANNAVETAKRAETRLDTLEGTTIPGLSNQIATETGTRQSEIERVTGLITDERDARELADNSLDDRITLLNDRMSVLQTEMVIIGDSYSTTGYDALASELWWVKVAQQLNLNPHNYAVGGTGYNDPSAPKFYAQVDSAANDTAFDNDTVRYVFIFGGRNDFNYMTNLQATVISVIEHAKVLFPKSQIVVMGVNTWVSFAVESADKCDFALVQQIYHACMQTGVTFINTLDWLVGQTSWFGGNGHPNASGHMAIASRVLSALSGSSGTIFRRINCTSSTSNPYNNIFVTNSNGRWVLTGITDLDANGKATITVPNKIAMLTWGLTTPAGLSNNTRTLVYGQCDIINSTITLTGDANARITMNMPFALNSE